MKVKQEKQGEGSKERPGDGCPWEDGECYNSLFPSPLNFT